MHLVCSHVFIVAVDAGEICRNSREMKVVSQQGSPRGPGYLPSQVSEIVPVLVGSAKPCVFLPSSRAFRFFYILDNFIHLIFYKSVCDIRCLCPAVAAAFGNTSHHTHKNVPMWSK